MALPISKIFHNPEYQKTTLGCCCGHYFTEDQVEKRRWLFIEDEIDCDPDEFDLDEYIEEQRLCPECGDCCKDGHCCEFSDNKYDPDDDEDVSYMCGDCLTEHDDEDEAKACCTELDAMPVVPEVQPVGSVASAALPNYITPGTGAVSFTLDGTFRPGDVKSFVVDGKTYTVTVS